MSHIQHDSEILLRLYLHGPQKINLMDASGCIENRLDYAGLLDEGLVAAEYHEDWLTVGITKGGRKVVEEALDASRTAPVH